MTRPQPVFYLVPGGVLVLILILRLLGVFDGWEGRVYDAFLHAKPAVPESPTILMVDIDDTAVGQVGPWPWSRDVMADGLILMKELGAASATLDIEYVNPGPRGLDPRTLEVTVPDALSQEFAQIQGNVQDLFKGLRNGSISMKAAAGYVDQLSQLTDEGKTRLLAVLKGVSRDNDQYLGEAVRLFGNTWLTVNTGDQTTPSTSAATGAVTKLALPRITVESDPVAKTNRMEPTLPTILDGAAGAGFPNVVVDSDGVRRRIDLLQSYQGKYYAQLAFRPVLSWLGDPALVLRSGELILKDVPLPRGGKGDLSLPLTDGGRFLIQWPHESFLKSFRHISFYELVLHQRYENDLVYNLRLMRQAGYLAYDAEGTDLVAQFDAAETLRQQLLSSGKASGMTQYRDLRDAWLKRVTDFLASDAADRLQADLDQSLAEKGLSDSETKGIRDLKIEAAGLFTETKGLADNLNKVRNGLKPKLAGAFVLVGETATSTTDIGVTPFSGESANLGLHAAVANSIFQGQFLQILPWWVGLLLAAVMVFGTTPLILWLRAGQSIAAGGLLVIIVAGGLLELFVFTGIFLDPVIPALATFLTYLLLIGYNFMKVERERGEVRGAFSRYLSPDVIKELLDNPELLRLGGEKKQLTALFTDVKGFSTISEQLDPDQLVTLLNEYLTEMSNIVLDLGGTIDKYEGDAIIAFFGAPLEVPDHAARTLTAAVRMRRAEVLLNERFLAEGLSPAPLLTRFGINTGSMVVGNMGTVRKMDYTIMGNAVNLAARLEGVNKQYGTWILAAEQTVVETGAGFVTRKLDRVRVVGIQQPVRLYEIIEEVGQIDAKKAAGLEEFQIGLTHFEERRWAQAEKSFRKVLESIPQDGPAEIYIKRCQKFQVKPPLDTWDGVFELTSK